jgi:uncharacterized coiled-coil DUF342 family protein
MKGTIKMAETNKQKLNKLVNKKTQLQIKLAKIATEREMYHKTSDGSLHFFYSQRNPKHNAHRSRMDAQIRNIKKQIEMYERKIQELKSAS